MLENQQHNSHCEPIFQRSCQTSRLTKEYSFRLRHQVRGTFLEDFMEEVGNEFVIYLILSSSDGWANESCEHNLGIFTKDLGD
jgi:hypothetical protein